MLLTKMDDLALTLTRPRWTTVYEIPAGTALVKGRNGLSRCVIEAGRTVRGRYGCYCWSGVAEVLYCGSFSSDYAKGKFASNFEGRLYQYFCNHRRRDDGSANNTNALVYDRLNQQLTEGSVALRLFGFDSCRWIDDEVSVESYERDPSLVRAIERLLIWMYKRQGQCAWNDREKPA